MILTSCVPGIIALIFDNFTLSVMPYIQNQEVKITELLSETRIGTPGLISEIKISFRELIDEVSTRGSTTKGGVDVLNTMLPEVYKNMFEKMIER